MNALEAWLAKGGSTAAQPNIPVQPKSGNIILDWLNSGGKVFTDPLPHQPPLGANSGLIRNGPHVTDKNSAPAIGNVSAEKAPDATFEAFPHVLSSDVPIRSALLEISVGERAREAAAGGCCLG